MRYVKIAFLCDPVVLGFMEVDAAGNLARLTTLEGKTIKPKAMPNPAYSVINDEPDFPAWGTPDPEPQPEPDPQPQPG